MSTMEGYIFGSTDFMMRLNSLSKMSDKTGEIAKAIIDLIDDEEWLSDKDIKQNYFDLTDKDDTVSFIQQNRIPSDWDEEENPSLPYTMKGRNEIKIGKIVKYLLPYTNIDTDGIKDKHIEEFVNVFKATKVSSSLEFKLLNGKDIAKYYNSDKYFSKSGSLGGSCMADESKSTFKIYTENESKVQLLVLMDKDNMIFGRALVWKLKKSPCEAKYFMDRVYTNRDSDVIKFRMYADEKGWLQKKRMNSTIEDNVSFTYKGSDVFGEVTCKVDGDFKYYPFVDTMCFLNKDKKEVSNIPYKNCSILHSVSGDNEPCDSCDGKLFNCYDCDDDEMSSCDDCDSSGDTDSGKCVTCKGKGEIKCEHENGSICGDCCSGVSILIKKGIETEISKILKRK